MSIDTYDLTICVALWGGFVYGEWWPFLLLIVWLIFADWIEIREKVDRFIEVRGEPMQ